MQFLYEWLSTYHHCLLIDASHKRRSRNIFQPWRFTSWIVSPHHPHPSRHIQHTTPTPNKSQAYACTFNVSPSLVVANKLTPRMPQDFFPMLPIKSIKWKGPKKSFGSFRLADLTVQHDPAPKKIGPKSTALGVRLYNMSSKRRMSNTFISFGSDIRRAMKILFLAMGFTSDTSQSSWFTKPLQRIKCPWFQRREKGIHSFTHATFLHISTKDLNILLTHKSNWPDTKANDTKEMIP